MRLPNSRRAAFTLLELMIVLSVITLLAALGVGQVRKLIPRYRAREAAKNFTNHLQQARQYAIMNNVQARVLLTDFDADITSASSDNAGAYKIQIGNKVRLSDFWDTLPFEGTGTDAATELGTIDLSKGANEYAKGVSIDQWANITGPGSGNADAIVFTPRGWLDNPVGDFDSNGAIVVKFVNKYAIADGMDEYYEVMVYRGGMTRVESSYKTWEYSQQVGGTNTSSSSE